MEYDLIVIGLGPAGSIAARNAARLGLRVLAIDQSLFPRRKICGGGLSPRVRAFFEGGAIPEVETVVTELGLTFHGKRTRLSFEDPIAYLVCRDRFDHALLAEAKDAGARIITGNRVQRIAETDDYFSAFTGHGEYRAAAGIGADGAIGITSRFMNPRNTRKGFPGFEGEASLKADASESRIEIDVGVSPGGYGWKFPKGDRTSLGIAAIGTNKKIRREFIEFADSHNEYPGSPVQGAGHPLPLWRKDRARKIHSQKLLLAGDAAGLVDPFFGEGIYYAMRSGELAAAAAARFIRVATPLSSYEEAVRREFYPEFRGARRLARIVYSSPGIFFKLASRHPGVLNLYADILRGKRNYRNFLSTVFQTGLRKLLFP